jgi:predicted secreted Zn-dependent protease
LLVQGWPRYLAKLTEHEMGHRDNGVRAAFAVRDAITAIAPMADCGQLESAADAAGNAAIAQLKDADVEYDRKTAHGARQGVALP